MSKRHAIKSSSKRYFDLRSWWILEFQSFFSLLWHKCIWNRGRSTVAAFRPFFCQSWNSTHYSLWSNQHLILFNIKHDFLLRRLFKRGFVVILFSYAVYEEFIGNFTWRSLTAASVLSVTICFVPEFALCSLTCYLNTIELFKEITSILNTE